MNVYNIDFDIFFPTSSWHDPTILNPLTAVCFGRFLETVAVSVSPWFVRRPQLLRCRPGHLEGLLHPRHQHLDHPVWVSNRLPTLLIGRQGTQTGSARRIYAAINKETIRNNMFFLSGESCIRQIMLKFSQLHVIQEWDVFCFCF